MDRYITEHGEGVYTDKNSKQLHRSVFNLNWLKSPKIIFDVGAWDFGDSIRLKQQYPEAEVYAFELLEDNYNKFSPYANSCGVKTFNKAINDVTGVVSFYEGRHVHGDDAQSSLLKPSQQYESNYGHIVKHTKSEKLVECQTISDFCKEHGIVDIDLIHIDVEGAEYQILNGLGEIRPKLIFAEFLIDQGWENQKSFKETLDLLDKLCYNCVGNYSFDKLFALRGSEYE